MVHRRSYHFALLAQLLYKRNFFAVVDRRYRPSTEDKTVFALIGEDISPETWIRGSAMMGGEGKRAFFRLAVTDAHAEQDAQLCYKDEDTEGEKGDFEPAGFGVIGAEVEVF